MNLGTVQWAFSVGMDKAYKHWYVPDFSAEGKEVKLRIDIQYTVCECEKIGDNQAVFYDNPPMILLSPKNCAAFGLGELSTEKIFAEFEITGISNEDATLAWED